MLSKLTIALREHGLSLLKRFAVFGDKSAFLLTAPFAVALFYVDQALAKTLLQWLLFAPVLAGVAVVVSRIIFPHIDLHEHADSAKSGNIGSGLVVAAIVIFVGLLVIALAGWARP